MKLTIGSGMENNPKAFGNSSDYQKLPSANAT